MAYIETAASRLKDTLWGKATAPLAVPLPFSQESSQLSSQRLAAASQSLGVCASQHVNSTDRILDSARHAEPSVEEDGGVVQCGLTFALRRPTTGRARGSEVLSPSFLKMMGISRLVTSCLNLVTFQKQEVQAEHIRLQSCQVQGLTLCCQFIVKVQCAVSGFA